MIKVTRYAKSLQKSVRYIRKRSFKNFNESEFCAAVKDISWWNVYSCEDAQNATEMFTAKINNILDKMAQSKHSKFMLRMQHGYQMTQRNLLVIEIMPKLLLLRQGILTTGDCTEISGTQ